MRNERGIALLSVLGILSVLLVLGAVVATSSRIETALSGSSRDSARAFAAADAGLQLALGDVANFVDLSFTCAAATARTTDLDGVGLGIQGDVEVCFDREGLPPPSIKVSALKFRAFHFNMDATGVAPVNASARLGMEAARLGPAE